MLNSVIHNFQARSSEILFLHDSRFTRHFKECNPKYNLEPLYFVFSSSYIVFVRPSKDNVMSIF